MSGILQFWQEKGATDAIEKLLAIVKVKAMVRRDEKEFEVPVEAIVPGDIVVLSAGDIIPGDALILGSKDLFVDEASLTGETYPVEKAAGPLPAETPLAGRKTPFLWGRTWSAAPPRGRHRQRARQRVRKSLGPAAAAAAGNRIRTRHPALRFSAGRGHAPADHRDLRHQRIFQPPGAGGVPLFAGAGGRPDASAPPRHHQRQSRPRRPAHGEEKSDRQAARLDREFRQHERPLFGQDRHPHRRQVVFRSALDVTGKENEKALLYAYLNSSLRPVLPTRSMRRSGIARAGHFRLSKVDEVPYDFERKRLSIMVAKDGDRPAS